MSEMEERVARAIWSSEPRHHSARDFDRDATNREKFDAKRAARAAIEAMREPTDEMLEAAWSSNWQGLSHNIAKRAWQAMLDEALK